MKSAVRALLPGKATGAGIAFAEGSEGRSLPLIQRAFAAVEGKPTNAIPVPKGLYPTGDTTRLLGPGARQMGPITPDASSVQAQDLAPHQQVPRMRKALPPGGAPFTQGTSVPDVLGKPGQGIPYNAGLLEPPIPGQPPLNVQPRGPSSVQGPPYMPMSAGRPIPLGPITPPDPRYNLRPVLPPGVAGGGNIQ
jgi:hypothetical protein